MSLPDGFQFSQSNLQDYVDCPRRFQLRSLLHLSWPAIEASPALENERFLLLGSTFHYLIRQHQTGLSIEQLSSIIDHSPPSERELLSQWWESYLAALRTPGELYPILHSDAICTPEITLSAPLGNYRLVAKYDLLVFDPGGQAVIIDWKTNQSRPPRRSLMEKLQTKVYPYLLVRAGMGVAGGRQIHPSQVEMLYWFANYPDQTERFLYSDEQFQADERYIYNLIDQIRQAPNIDYPLTHDERRCHFCVYRSLCERGIQAGQLDERLSADLTAVELDFDFDLEQIDEIEY